MSKVESILAKYCNEHGTFYHISSQQDGVIDGEIAAVFQAMKEIAQLSFDAGMERRGEEIDGSYNQHPVMIPNKEQFINQLFNDTP